MEDSTPRSLPELKVLILLTTVFINSFVVYTRVLSYNEGHEASLKLRERCSGTDHQGAGFI